MHFLATKRVSVPQIFLCYEACTITSKEYSKILQKHLQEAYSILGSLVIRHCNKMSNLDFDIQMLAKSYINL